MTEAIVPSGGEKPAIPVSLEASEGDSVTDAATKLRLLGAAQSIDMQMSINSIKAPAEGAKVIEVRT